MGILKGIIKYKSAIQAREAMGLATLETIKHPNDKIEIEIENGNSLRVNIEYVPFRELLKQMVAMACDFSLAQHKADKEEKIKLLKSA